VSVYRSRVLDSTGTVLAILPTWSDGAIVAEYAPHLTVQDGEWHCSADSAPDPTHQTGRQLLAELGIAD